MIPPLVISDRGVTVVGGGAVGPADLEVALAVAPTLVAADGGTDRALSLGHPPDWVIGDLDSISAAARRLIPVERVHHIAEQDSTDFTKCLTRIAAPFVMAVGFSGLRLDHTLAVLTTMSQVQRPPVILLASDDLAFLAPPRMTLPLMPGTRVSLYPMGPARGVSTGLEWPIEGIEFSPGGRVGTSNMASGLVTLRIEGRMLVMLPRDTLATVLTALRLPRP
ncbi:thiamine diphosphokinase [Paracoccus spongiarum]|uniref:Thiamine diphosphokinase n=1 Tax=Paracoccus spongiarum TaxID=3064387 RepID=A0ABT9JA49_9RHOB|nr:thiamine diphosphokinase [Paracoccus sp. 2205BS29-5]MDP5306032.1 thiamine diphosphokinase [Paracoccus sp. 2205BS29-5]